MPRWLEWTFTSFSGFRDQDLLSLEDDVVGDRQFVPEVPELGDDWLAILSLLRPAMENCGPQSLQLWV